MPKRPLPLRDESRERLADFINGADYRTQQWLFDQLIARLGLEALSDDALHELVHEHVRSFWANRRNNRLFRERYRQQKGTAA